ncbi:MAG: tetratricopeptide repeat protein [Candidatus Aminicenantes bacterium]|nr:MAG: tetratricopeptide repeat protein [Candidatus Aminicenantes bacterium]
MKMKHFMITLCLVLWLSPGQIQAQTKSAADEAFMNFDKITSVIKVDSVIGEPIRVQDTIIIPFSKISYGMGAGGAMMGFGGGMGGKTIPLGVLIIEGEDIRVELFPLEEKKPSFLQEMLPVLLQMLPQFLEKKSAPKAPAPDITPGSPAVPSDVSLEQVEKLYNEKKYQEALKAIESLIASQPENAELHAWKGSIMGTLSQGDNPADMIKYGMGAMQSFETALDLDPNNVRGRFGRGIGRLMAPEGFGGDVDGAIEDLKVALKKEPFPDAYFYLGEAYKRKGQLDLAKQAYQEALILKPDFKLAKEALEGIK